MGMDLKPKTPCGQLPVLTYEGTEVSQSMAIARFVARQCNLAGASPIEQAQVDMIVDCMTDLLNAGMPAYREQDEAKKAELMKKFGTETMPNTMAILEKLLTKNGGKYFVGKNVTWADIEVANFWDGIKQRGSPLDFGANKALEAHINAIWALPNIKAWMEKRPKTPM